MYLDTQVSTIDNVPQDEDLLLEWMSLRQSTSNSRSFPLDVVYKGTERRVEFTICGLALGSDLTTPHPIP